MTVDSSPGERPGWKGGAEDCPACRQAYMPTVSGVGWCIPVHPRPGDRRDVPPVDVAGPRAGSAPVTPWQAALLAALIDAHRDGKTLIVVGLPRQW